MNLKNGIPEFKLNDLNSRNGTYLRLSEKNNNSDFFPLYKNCKFNLAFEIFFEVVEIFYDI